METCQILIAEDDPNLEFLLQRAFDSSAPGIRVQFTPHGEATVDYLRFVPTPPPLLLLDIKMPRMDGFEVLKWLQGCPAMRPKTIAVFTTSTQASDRAAAATLGADLYFVKPMGFDELRSMAAAFAGYARSGCWPPAAILGAELRSNGDPDSVGGPDPRRSPDLG